MEHLIEENEECRKCACLPDMLSNSPCQLGALTSESFSERIISVANLLVDVHRILLDQSNIDNVIVLLMSKRFMKRSRHKEAFASVIFHDVLSNEYASTNVEWNC